MQANYKLKLLSGTLSGVEFTLGEGDSVFHIGPHRDLVDGIVAETLASADNTFYIPDEKIAAAFVVRIVADVDNAGTWQVSFGEKDEAGAWQFRAAVSHVVERVAGLYLALRPGDESWASAVLGFRPGEAASLVPLSLASAQRAGSGRVRYLFAGALLIALASLGYVVQQRYAPESKVRGLVGVLRGAPADYVIAYGTDHRLYAFTDSPAGVAWGQRASHRLGRGDSDVFLDRAREAERLGALLTSAGIDYAVIRLQDPTKPEVVLSGERLFAETVKAKAQALLARHMPYAQDIRMDSVSDSRLVALARERLLSFGVTSRLDANGHRVSVSNDVFLDDAALHAMARYAGEFSHYWGDRRISINIRLWDDLLKGRSYQYSPGQLLSVGRGRWEFSRSVKH
jgi:Type III secretion system protein PrgH-EprH (PrgH)